MNQQDKELLLKDLSTRLPYGVILNTPNGNKPLLALVSSKKYNTIVVYNDYHGNENDISEWEGGDIEFIKPYLRPMSSMSEKESKEFGLLQTDFYTDGFLYPIAALNLIDWLNAHHFDYRGLIERGLALEAPEGMYNIKKK